MTTWTLPSLDVLEPEDRTPIAVHVDCQGVADALREHKIGVVEVAANIGPQAVRYLIRLEPGVLPSKVERATPAIGLALGAPPRYAGVIGDRVAVEVARSSRAGVTLSRVLGDPAATSPDHALPIPVGVDLDGHARMDDLASLPHLIVAGTTGAGKSAYLHAVVTSLLMRTTPDDVRLHLVDPKHVELTAYDGAPHVAEIVTTASGALDLLRRFVEMMDTRYGLLKEQGVRDIDAYNAKVEAWPLERHVVVVEELADLLMSPVGPAIGKRLERVAQLGRAAGLHLVVATQRPSAKVLPELLRANVPARAVFAVATPSDGLVALGAPGAYGTLTGKGDGLFKVPGVGDPVRFQSPFVSAAEVARVVAWWKRQAGEPEPDVSHIPASGSVLRDDPGVALRASLDLEAMQRDAERAEAMREAGLEPSYRTPEDILAGYGFTPEVVSALTAVITDGVVAGIRKELGL